MQFRKKSAGEAGISHGSRGASYVKPVVERNATTAIKESLLNKYTNLAYTVTGGLQRFKSAFNEKSNQYRGYIYILGRRFATREEAISYFHTLVWFTYREIPGMTKDIHSDTSWGCLIRVGQMAMAAALKRHLKLKTQYNEDSINFNLIPAFLDQEDRGCKYSLTKIVEEANKMFNMKYGQWFSVSQICSVLSLLHQKDPMRGTENLKILFYPYSQLFISDVCALMGVSPCNCQKRRVACSYCNKVTSRVDVNEGIETFYDQESFEASKSVQTPYRRFNAPEYEASSYYVSRKLLAEKHVLLFITCQLSYNAKVNESKYRQLKEILSLDCSLGIIGGVPRRGLYFLGFDENDNKMLYLDPHYVQDEVSKSNLMEKMRTFFCSEIRRCSREEIDPSMAFVFYLEDLRALQKLHDKIEELREKYDDYILSVGWENEFAQRQQSSEFEELDMDYDEKGDLDNSFIMDD